MSVSVFMISRDASACRAGSATAARIASYGRQGASITVACLTPWNAISVVARGLVRVRRGWVVTSQDPFEAGMIAWLIARLRGARVELQLHGDFFEPRWKTRSWHRLMRLVLARFLLRRADAVRTVSGRVRRSLTGIVPEGRIAVIPTPVTVVPPSAVPVDGQRIAYAGRFVPVKNLPMLLRAFASLARDFSRARLVLRGGGPEQNRLLAEAERLGVTARVAFEPWQEGVGGVGPAGIVALASWHESWSRLAVEAALASRAVVMTDVGCAGEVIVDGESGWVVPVGDEAAFAVALRDALAHPEEARRRGENARRAAERLPDAAELTRRIVAAWEGMVRP